MLLYYVRIHILFFYKSISVLHVSIIFIFLLFYFFYFFIYFLGIAEFAKEGAERNLGAPKVHLSFTLDGSGIVTLSKAEVSKQFLSHCIVLRHIGLLYFVVLYCIGFDCIIIITLLLLSPLLLLLSSLLLINTLIALITIL